jgi:GDSL-like Lipase/Acylhydrolase family
MAHIVLVGDSIFDNARYTEGGPDVIAQVRQLLPRGWQASLLAVDGSTTENIPAQVERLPSDASHLVLSVGGNDAIMNADILNKPAQSTAQALSELNEVSKNFEGHYRRAVETCRRRGLPLAICTIYNGNFPDPKYQQLISTALMVFNDVILRVGIEYGLAIIDLRLIFSSPEDYANPIEPFVDWWREDRQEHCRSCVGRWERRPSRRRVNPPTSRRERETWGTHISRRKHQIKTPTLSYRTRQGWGTLILSSRFHSIHEVVLYFSSTHAAGFRLAASPWASLGLRRLRLIPAVRGGRR